MLSGPARLDEMQRTLDVLQRQVNDLKAGQDEQLAEIRSSVGVVLDDVTARLGALDQARTDEPSSNPT